jgi:hypothetical protein
MDFFFAFLGLFGHFFFIIFFFELGFYDYLVWKWDYWSFLIGICFVLKKSNFFFERIFYGVVIT